LRRGNIIYNEYIQVGKGRDVGLNQISKFEAKVANGNSEQTISRDIHRLGRRFDFFRMLSCYFTTVGFYFNSLVCSLSLSLSLSSKVSELSYSSKWTIAISSSYISFVWA
jgi:callose synthase